MRPSANLLVMPRNALVLGSLAVVCLFALLWSIENQPEPRRLWGDEIHYWSEGTDNGPDIVVAENDLLWPPLYSQFVRWASLEGRSRGLLQAIQALFLLAIAFLSRSLWLSWVGTPRGGWMLFFLVMLFPELTAFSFYLWPELLHLLLLLGIAWILTEHRDETSWLIGLGILFGLALLTKSLLGPFLPILLLPLFQGGLWRRGVSRVAVVLISTAVVVGPVIIKTGLEQGSYIISDSSRFNLWVGLNDTSIRNFDGAIVYDEYLRYRDAGSTFAERNDALAEWTRRLVRERGLSTILASQFERQYFRLFDRVSLLGDMLPGGAAPREGGGYVDTPGWKARLLRRSSYVLYGSMLLLAPLGLTVVSWRERPWMKMLLLFVLYNLAIFLFLHVKARYRIQFLPAFMLWSVLGIEWLLDRKRTMPPSWHWIPGVLAASLLLVFAFGRGILF